MSEAVEVPLQLIRTELTLKGKVEMQRYQDNIKSEKFSAANLENIDQKIIHNQFKRHNQTRKTDQASDHHTNRSPYKDG